MNVTTSPELIAVHEWLAADGTVLGCGTALELEHWTSEGVQADSDRLGRVLGYEPASEDARRLSAWAREAA